MFGRAGRRLCLPFSSSRLPVPLWFLHHKCFLIINYLSHFLELVSFAGAISLTSSLFIMHPLPEGYFRLDAQSLGSNDIWFNTSCPISHSIFSVHLSPAMTQWSEERPYICICISSIIICSFKRGKYRSASFTRLKWFSNQVQLICSCWGTAGTFSAQPMKLKRQVQWADQTKKSSRC